MVARALLLAAVTLVLLAPAEVRADDADGAMAPRSSRSRRLTKTEEQERDRLLDLATQYRARANELRERADGMFQKNKTDMGQELADKADTIEDKARDLEEEADEIDHPLGRGLPSRHRAKRPSFRGSDDRRRD